MSLTTDPIALGNHAARLLADEVLTAVFEDIQAECVKTWMATGFSATEDREKVWHHAQAVRVVRDRLQSMMDNGKIAAAQIEAEQKQAEE